MTTVMPMLAERVTPIVPMLDPVPPAVTARPVQNSKLVMMATPMLAVVAMRIVRGLVQGRPAAMEITVLN